MECSNCLSKFDEMGYCIDCGNSGWQQMQDRIAELEAEVKDARKLWKFQDETLNECYGRIDGLEAALHRIKYCAGSNTIAKEQSIPCGFGEIYEIADQALKT